MVTMEEIRAETEAYKDQARRIARNDLDWGLYFEGDVRPHFPWWRRLLKL